MHEELHQLDLQIAADGPCATLTIGGELDATSSPRVISAAHDLAEGPVTGIELDCDGVWFLDSAGVRALIVMRNEAIRMGVEFAVVRASATVTRILELTGLTTTLTRSSPN